VERERQDEGLTGDQGEAAAASPGPPRWVIPALLATATAAALIAGWSWTRLAELRASGGSGSASMQALESGPAADLHGFALLPVKAAPSVELTDQNGQPFDLSELQGSAVLLFFGFTHCPDICPTTLAQLAAARSALEERADDVKVVFVTIDPERDTAERLADYLGRFDPAFIGLTGSADEIAEAAQNYGIFYEKEYPNAGGAAASEAAATLGDVGDAGGSGDAGTAVASGAAADTDDYSMAHTSTIYLIDPDGNLIAGYLDPAPADLAADMRTILENAAADTGGG